MRDRVERIESVKAGSFGGLAAGMSYGLILVVDRSLLAQNLALDFSFLWEIAIAMIGGFLFGITYRYIIRTDRNNHLNSGAVLAFGLVRGLAQVDIQTVDLFVNGVVVIENILLFAIARYAIDSALRWSWIIPFK
jgi:hypothetical protein